MTPERWRQIESLLQEALEREPAERAAFLERACAGDAGLREELELLLASPPAESFLAANALEDATMLFGAGEAGGRRRKGCARSANAACLSRAAASGPPSDAARTRGRYASDNGAGERGVPSACGLRASESTRPRPLPRHCRAGYAAYPH